MDNKGIGVLVGAILAVGGLIVVAAAGAGIYYMTDQAVGATVIDKQCGGIPTGSSSTVTIRTEFPIPGIEHTLQDFDNSICNGLRADETNGNYAEYYLKSERTVLFEREGGRCLYDSNGVVCG